MEIKPDSKKIILFSFSKVIGILLLFGSLLWFLNSLIDLKWLFSIFKEFGFEMDFSALMPTLSIGALLLATGLVLEYMTLSKLRYVFYQDHFTYYQNFLIFQVSEIDIPYHNIVKITFERMTLFNAGNIDLELSSMKQKSVTLKFVNNVEQAAKDILQIINNYRATYYAQKSAEYKYDQILNKGRI